jgi:hypothetical protein
MLNYKKKCILCGLLVLGTCEECWTQCQICSRGMNTQDCSSINVEGFEDADFCIQCSSNLFAFNNFVDSNAVIRFAQSVRPFIDFLGTTNVLFVTGTTTCVVCDHRIPSNWSCCTTCSFKYYVKLMGRILPRSHFMEILNYIGSENLH